MTEERTGGWTQRPCRIFGTAAASTSWWPRRLEPVSCWCLSTRPPLPATWPEALFCKISWNPPHHHIVTPCSFSGDKCDSLKTGIVSLWGAENNPGFKFNVPHIQADVQLPCLKVEIRWSIQIWYTHKINLGLILYNHLILTKSLHDNLTSLRRSWTSVSPWSSSENLHSLRTESFSLLLLYLYLYKGLYLKKKIKRFYQNPTIKASTKNLTSRVIPRTNQESSTKNPSCCHIGPSQRVWKSCCIVSMTICLFSTWKQIKNSKP